MGNLVSWNLENQMQTLAEKQGGNLVYKQMVNWAGNPASNHVIKWFDSAVEVTLGSLRVTPVAVGAGLVLTCLQPSFCV